MNIYIQIEKCRKTNRTTIQNKMLHSLNQVLFGTYFYYYYMIKFGKMKSGCWSQSNSMSRVNSQSEEEKLYKYLWGCIILPKISRYFFGKQSERKYRIDGICSSLFTIHNWSQTTDCKQRATNTAKKKIPYRIGDIFSPLFRIHIWQSTANCDIKHDVGIDWII